ncbi:hypothetical protein [Lysobacter gummosus]
MNRWAASASCRRGFFVGGSFSPDALRSDAASLTERHRGQSSLPQ